jgi:hypothetical protein
VAEKSASKAVPQTLEDTLSFYGKKLFGSGKAAEAAKTIENTPRRRDSEMDRQVNGASAPADDGRSKMVDEKSGIRFAKGGMVRRGYGKARGA